MNPRSIKYHRQCCRIDNGISSAQNVSNRLPYQRLILHTASGKLADNSSKSNGLRLLQQAREQCDFRCAGMRKQVFANCCQLLMVVRCQCCRIGQPSANLLKSKIIRRVYHESICLFAFGTSAQIGGTSELVEFCQPQWAEKPKSSQFRFSAFGSSHGQLTVKLADDRQKIHQKRAKNFTGRKQFQKGMKRIQADQQNAQIVLIGQIT